MNNKTHIHKQVFSELKLTEEKKYSTDKSALNTDV